MLHLLGVCFLINGILINDFSAYISSYLYLEILRRNKVHSISKRHLTYGQQLTCLEVAFMNLRLASLFSSWGPQNIIFRREFRANHKKEKEERTLREYNGNVTLRSSIVNLGKRQIFLENCERLRPHSQARMSLTKKAWKR